MGKSPQQAANEQAAATARSSMTQAYGVGIPLMRDQQTYINQGLNAGEPQYMKDAFTMQRGILTDANALQGRSNQAQADLAVGKLQQGGNFQNVLNPLDMGAKLAQQLYTSRTSQALGALEEQNKLMGMGIGQAQAAGSDSLAAGMNQMNAIGMMQPFNSTYANILGGVNLAANLYGGGVKSGWFTGGGGGGGWPAGGGPGTGGTWTGGGVAFP